MTPRQQDAVLWQWSTTTKSGGAIAKELGLSRGAVLGFIHRRRLAGDCRATARAVPTKPQPDLLACIARLEAELYQLKRAA